MAAARSQPPADPDEIELARLGAAWEEFLGAVRRARARTGDRGDGLSLSQYEFLRPLADGGGLGVSALAERFGVAPATATGILDGLERAGMIARGRTERDRRAVTITLTPAGRRALERKRRSIGRRRRALLGTIGAAERAQTERLLRHLAGVIDGL
jgi:DNA-binding MarR family transcriptional regulator